MKSKNIVFVPGLFGWGPKELGEFGDRLCGPVADHAMLSGVMKPPRDIAFHPAKTNHTQLHRESFFYSAWVPSRVRGRRRIAGLEQRCSAITRT
jgi:hypothetical protein